MDLGLAGLDAIVCGASKGLGRACALALAREGANLVINARGREALEATAEAIRAETGARVVAVAADVASPEGRAAILEACPEPDILVNNAGGPPPGDYRDWDRETWIAALDANMLSPIALMQAVVDGMVARGFGRVVNITSGAVKAPIAHLGLSNGARSGLTGFVAGLARQVAGSGVTVNNLLPGAFATDRMNATYGKVAAAKGISLEAAKAERLATIPAGRFGEPAEFGALCAYLCSRQAGYVTGQNWLIDGGAYPGTF